jgi:hypothetical protein
VVSATLPRSLNQGAWHKQPWCSTQRALISAGERVSSNEPASVLFGYLRHSLVGRGVELFGVILLVLNFIDGLYKLAKLDWHVAYQIAMTFCYIALSIRLILRGRDHFPFRVPLQVDCCYSWKAKSVSPNQVFFETNRIGARE